jgi:tryptophanyl-tRNA synthetase
MDLGGKGNTMNDKPAEDKEFVSIDPWGSSTISDYDDLFTQFGIEKFDQLLSKINDPNHLMRRGIIFGHRGYDSIIDAINSKNPFAVLSGFMPTGNPHIGHKMVFDEIVWHQKNGGHAYALIADLEAHAARKLSWDEIDRHSRNYVLSLLAAGFDPDKGEIYRQSENRDVQDLAFELGIQTNFSEMRSIYGFSDETEISHIQSVLTQAADILYPQLQNPKPTVIPVGPDQDPHLRLTRDLASRMCLFSVTESYASFESDPAEKEHLDMAFNELSGDNNKLQCSDVVNWIQKNLSVSTSVQSILVKLLAATSEEFYPRVRILNLRADSELFKTLCNQINGKIQIYKEHIDIFGADKNSIELLVREFEIGHGGYAFYPPSSIYHRFMSGLTGGKMSSSIPDSHISLFEDPQIGYEKVKKSITGGRETAELQRDIGGEPDKCPVYELYAYLLSGEDDNHAKKVHKECVTGNRLCGDCKEEAANLMREFLTDHQNKIIQAEPLMSNLFPDTKNTNKTS